MTRKEIEGLDKNEQMTFFYKVANKVGLVVDGYYESGDPVGSNEDIDMFYKVEDCLSFPMSCKIPKKHL